MIIIPKAQIMVMPEIGIGEVYSSLDDYFLKNESKRKNKQIIFKIKFILLLWAPNVLNVAIANKQRLFKNH